MDNQLPTTEQPSAYSHLDQMSTDEIVDAINQEDQKVALAVANQKENIVKLIDAVHEKMSIGGRLFYIGAGTSGRLGVVDASECPPTFGVAHDLVVGLIAGGDGAIRKAVEFAEDNPEQAWKDLEVYDVTENDVVVGIAASGSTPYVIGGLLKANEKGMTTGAITCNHGSKMGVVAKFPVEVNVGPEFVTGSTRMKSGTAQKMVLNMLSTGVMIKLGKVKGNKMIDMQLSNQKLLQRAERMIMTELHVGADEAKALLKQWGSVRGAIENR